MSFDISGPGPARKPVIRETQSMENNGGGGNLGYMQQGKKKKDEEDEFEMELQILEDNIPSSDTFNKENKENKEEKEDNKEEETKEERPNIFLNKIKNIIKPENNS